MPYALVEVDKDELNLLVEQMPKVMKTEFVSLVNRLREEGMEKGMERKNLNATENTAWRGRCYAAQRI